MTSAGRPSPESDRTNPINLAISPDVILSLATIPLLVGLVGQQALSRTLKELGELSEEWFRGDRLPILDLTPPSDRSASE